MKPYIHAESSAKHYGGKPEDYLDIHQFMDSSKAVEATNLHRIFFHGSHGCFIVEQVFGKIMTNSSGRKFSVRSVAEDHCLEDFRQQFLPNLSDYVKLIRANKETTEVLQQIDRWAEEFKDFWANNPEILDFLNQPLYLSGSPLGLLVTWNSWFLGKIVPLVFGKGIPFLGFKPCILFENMENPLWINNGKDILPRMKEIKLAPVNMNQYCDGSNLLNPDNNSLVFKPEDLQMHSYVMTTD